MHVSADEVHLTDLEYNCDDNNPKKQVVLK